MLIITQKSSEPQGSDLPSRQQKAKDHQEKLKQLLTARTLMTVPKRNYVNNGIQLKYIWFQKKLYGSMKKYSRRSLKVNQLQTSWPGGLI